MCFLCVFWKRGKMCRNRPGREQNPKAPPFLFVWRVPRVFYSLGKDYEAAALPGLLTSNGPGWS